MSAFLCARRPAPDPQRALVAELGYFDQAHFVHDFRAATGRLPSSVARA